MNTGALNPGCLEAAESFVELGFVVVRSALAPPEVVAVRQSLDGLFKRGQHANQRKCFLEDVLSDPRLYGAIFRPEVVTAVRRALGDDVVFIADFEVHHNAFVIPGWHRDCASEGRATYLYRADYKFAKCGIVLQDYDNGWGGGLFVKPKSHRAFLGQNPLAWLARDISNRFQVRNNWNTFSVPVRAGDLIIFDSRLVHQSPEIAPERTQRLLTTPGGCWMLPEEHTKYVIYWDACHARWADFFLRNSERRARQEAPNPRREVGKEVIYSRYLAYHFPEDYSQEVVRLCAQLGVKIASLGRDQCLQFKERFRRLTAAELA